MNFLLAYTMWYLKMNAHKKFLVSTWGTTNLTNILKLYINVICINTPLYICGQLTILLNPQESLFVFCLFVFLMTGVTQLVVIKQRNDKEALRLLVTIRNYIQLQIAHFFSQYQVKCTTYPLGCLENLPIDACFVKSG